MQSNDERGLNALSFFVVFYIKKIVMWEFFLHNFFTKNRLITGETKTDVEKM